MFRHLFLLTLALLPGCAEPRAPAFHPDGDTVTRAVERAQAEVDRPRRQESGK